MFVLAGKIQIGDYIFTSVNNVEITKSTEDLVDTAVVKIPTKFKIRQNGEQKFVEEAIKPGDKVIITLAYESKYEGVEFKGFVSKVSPKIPMEIMCEDAMWLLRRKNINKVFAKTTLKEILNEVVKGTEIKLSAKVPEFVIDKLIIQNANGTQVLQKLKEDFAISVYLDDAGDLYAGLEQMNNIGQIAMYDLNYNLVENNLEFKTEDEKKLKVKYTYISKENKKTSVEVGDEDGELRTFTTSIVSSEAQLKAMANAELKKNKYAGFEGNVKSFLLPFATRGMAAQIIDKEHKNREGKYFIKKTVTTFGMDGARREVTIGNKI